MSRRPFVAHGESNAGLVRQGNEDRFLIDEGLGLYLVLDGMGGHSAGDVAAAMARDGIRAHVAARLATGAPRAVLEAAIRAASAEIFDRARQRRELFGMGTTVVACLTLDAHRVVIAHVGDSRAYLVRDGKLALLTGDHTVVAELVARGGLHPDEAERHPYKSVLSRNLGGREDVEVDVRELGLEPGDRLLLCSDGLNGFASHQALEQALATAADPSRAAHDLIELALRGGGGDNVTALVLQAERTVELESTVILRKNAASAWWSRRDRFLAEASARGVAGSPLCAVLSPAEAVSIVAGNLFDALSSDLEQTTGIYVWTYAENLASGWLDQGGGFVDVRRLIDALGGAVDAVIADVAAADPPLALVLEATAVRGLIVAEMALAAVVGERLRRLEDDLATIQGDDTLLPTVAEDRRRIPPPGGISSRGADPRSTRSSAPDAAAPRGPASPALERCLSGALAAAEQRLRRSGTPAEAVACLTAAHAIAAGAPEARSVLGIAGALFGRRPLTEGGLAPLIEGLDEARREHLKAACVEPTSEALRAAAVGRVGPAHQRLSLAIAELASEVAGTVGGSLRELVARTTAMRAELGRGEAELSRLQRDLRDSKTRDGFAPTGADG